MDFSKVTVGQVIQNEEAVAIIKKYAPLMLANDNINAVKKWKFRDVFARVAEPIIPTASKVPMKKELEAIEL